MRRETHPVFDHGLATDTAIWRYFDFPKFVALLQNRKLYFSRADLLGDPLEGSVTRAAAAQREQLLRNPPDGRTRAQMEEVFRHNERIFSNFPREAFVSCWHIGDHESMAMWHGYGGGPYGIAIRSTLGRLDTALPVTYKGPWREETIFVGPVKYVDYTSVSDQLPHQGNVYGRLMCKSLPYRHENELRAIFLDSSVGFADTPTPNGHDVPVDLHELVTNVVVSPLAPPWFESVVAKACATYELKAPIMLSVSAVPPVY